MTIRTNKDLALAYRMLRGIPAMLSSIAGVTDRDKINKAVKGLKQEIRRYHREQDAKREYTLVKDYGSDGYIVRFDLPDVSDPDGWFDDNERLTYRPSLYDCTGQAFTVWYEIHELGGRKVCWHSIGFDV